MDTFMTIRYRWRFPCFQHIGGWALATAFFQPFRRAAGCRRGKVSLAIHKINFPALCLYRKLGFGKFRMLRKSFC